MTQIQPFTHEAKGNLYYAPIAPGATDWAGLDPYYALHSRRKSYDGWSIGSDANPRCRS